MRLHSFLLFFALGGVSLAAWTWTPAAEADAAKQIDAMAQKALNATLAMLDSDVAAAKAAGQKPNCTRETLQYRPEL